MPGTRIVNPAVAGIRSRGTTRWAPRLGRIRIDGLANGWLGFGRPDARRIDDRARPDIELVAAEQVARAEASRAHRCAGSLSTAVARTRVTATGPGLGGKRGPQDGQRESSVVLHPVVVQQAAAKALPAQRRGDLEGLRPVEPPMPATVVPRPEDVVEGQSGVVERLVQERDPVDREQLRLER